MSRSTGINSSIYCVAQSVLNHPYVSSIIKIPPIVLPEPLTKLAVVVDI